MKSTISSIFAASLAPQNISSFCGVALAALALERRGPVPARRRATTLAWRQMKVRKCTMVY